WPFMGWQVAQETWPLAESLGSLNSALPCSISALLVWEAAGNGTKASAARTTRRFITISIPVLLVVPTLTYPRIRWITSHDAIICIYKYDRIRHALSSGGNNHAIRLLHPERQPLSQQSADGRGFPQGHLCRGAVCREDRPQLGVDRRTSFQSS